MFLGRSGISTKENITVVLECEIYAEESPDVTWPPEASKGVKVS